MASSKRPEPDALSTVVDVDAAGREQPLDEAAGATAFVRVDAVPERTAEVERAAPRRGLQVSLPDEEPPAPAAPTPAAPAEEKSGRRGAWWNAPRPREPEPDDLPGATAFVQAPAPAPEPDTLPAAPAEPA